MTETFPFVRSFAVTGAPVIPELLYPQAIEQVFKTLIHVHVLFCFSHGWRVAKSSHVVCSQTGLQSFLPALADLLLQSCQFLLLLPPDLHRLPCHR